MWGNTAEEFFKKREKIIQTLLQAGFTVKKGERPAWVIQSLGIKWQNGHCRIMKDVINKIPAMSQPKSKKET